jgi:hypothetical protein
MSVTRQQYVAFEQHAALVEHCSDHAIHLSRRTGMDPADIEAMTDFSRDEVLLVVVRCPKQAARYHHGKYPAKSMATSIHGHKSDPKTGLVTLPNGRIEVSDYDLMCVYRYEGAASYEKIFFSGVDPHRKQSPFKPEARDLLLKLQRHLKSKIQHGAQDDFVCSEHPGVSMGGAGAGGKAPDRFAVFNCGKAEFCPTPADVKARVYDRFGLAWPYDARGVHRSDARFGKG